MIRFIERHPFTFQLLAFAGSVFLFGANFTEESIPMYLAFSLALPLALISVFCFFVLGYNLITTWRNATNYNRLFSLVKLLYSVFSVFLNACVTGAYFTSIINT